MDNMVRYVGGVGYECCSQGTRDRYDLAILRYYSLGHKVLTEISNGQFSISLGQIVFFWVDGNRYRREHTNAPDKPFM